MMTRRLAPHAVASGLVPDVGKRPAVERHPQGVTLPKVVFWPRATPAIHETPRGRVIIAAKGNFMNKYFVSVAKK